MNNTSTIRQAALIALVILSAASVFAAGTPAGTVISNTATLSYKDLAGNSFPNVLATVTITVSQKAGVALTPATASQVVGDSVWAHYPFTVTNTGNGKDLFNLSSLSSKGWITVLFLDANKNGVLDPSEEGAGAVTATDSLPADSAAHFIARVFVPKGAPDLSHDTMTVSAVSSFNNTVSGSGLYATQVQRGIVSFSKSQDVSNPQPNQTITYTISYQNTGSGAATNFSVTDPLSVYLSLVNGSITGGGSYNSGTRTVSWTFPSIASGASGSVSFQARVVAGVSSGTIINNQAHLAYTDSTNGSPKDTTSNTTAATVAFLSGLSSTIDPGAQTQDAGLPVLYHLEVINDGNASDSVSLAAASTRGFSWKIYVDINGDGIVNGADSLVSLSKLGPIASGGSLKLIAVDTLLTSTADGTIDTTTFTFTSLTNSNSVTAQSGVTTVRAPVVTLTKTVAVVGGGLPVPGASLRYTITYSNTGTGASAQTVVSDPIPAFTAYTAESVHLNGVSKTDAASDDEVTVNGGTVTVTLGSVASGSSGTITFDVTIQ